MDEDEIAITCLERPVYLALLRMAADTSGQPLSDNERSLLLDLIRDTDVQPEDGVVVDG